MDNVNEFDAATTSTTYRIPSEIKEVLNKTVPMPAAVAIQLAERAVQRLSDDPGLYSNALNARIDIENRAASLAKILADLPGLPLTEEEEMVVRPPLGRRRHLPSPDRPYGHLAVLSPLGAPSITPLWVTSVNQELVVSTVENRIKSRFLSFDPMMAMSTPKGIGSPIGLEVCGFGSLTPDYDRALIGEVADLYSTVGIREHKDGHYTSWDMRERNRRLRVRTVAYRVQNTIGDKMTRRDASWICGIQPRGASSELSSRWSDRNHDVFWTDDDSTQDDLELLGSTDELAVLGVQPHRGAFRSLNATYGHVAIIDRFGLLRARQVGFDVIDCDGEVRIAFLVPNRGLELDSIARSPAAALSAVKFRIGGAWLQSQGLIALERPANIAHVIHRIERRYARPRNELALNLGFSWLDERTEYCLATISHQRLSSRYREAQRSERSRMVGSARTK